MLNILADTFMIATRSEQWAHHQVATTPDSGWRSGRWLHDRATDRRRGDPPLPDQITDF
jgi:hypothetical protein